MENTFGPALGICLSIALIMSGIFLGAGYYFEPSMATNAYIFSSVIAIVGGIACFIKNFKWSRSDH